MVKAILKVSLRPLVIGMFLGAALFFVYGRTSSQSPRPRIVTAEQTGCPLILLSTGVDSANALAPHYWYSITNTSDKLIAAYAIQQSVSLGPGAPTITTSFVHLPSESLLLRPYESRQDDGGVGDVYDKPPVEVTISVDFVEFTDGSRWGEDVSKSGDRLDGQRAGGQAAIKAYREILKDKGIQGLELALTSATPISAESGTASPSWQDGFRTGVSIVRHRLATAKGKKGPEGLRSELDKPFDSKSGRREP